MRRIAPLLVLFLLAPAGVAHAAGLAWPQAVMIGIVAMLYAFGWLAAGDSVPARERRVARGRGRPTPRAVA